MHYVGQIIRPPSEAHSIILQVTVGCSHNKCTFCGAYKDKRFEIKEDPIVQSDLDFAAQYCRNQNKVFLADGDALVIPFKRLKKIFSDIRIKLPWVNRISLYASARSIRSKSVEQLVELKKLGLDRVYLGLESGNDKVLALVKKGETAESMIAASEKIREAGLFLSAMVILGLAGRELSSKHAIETAKVLNKMQPKRIAALTLMLLDNTELARLYRDGRFELLEPFEMLKELRLLIDNLDTASQFFANHASNYLPIMGRVPRDREKMLEMIDDGLQDTHQLVPEGFRRL
ncbi:radical SAM protein [Desulfosediminicola ganghwensis]|uniref:radical SAM protein n=1 Tax=Desulfosediminicola ganghwensis TaxID=2569540 RepID=UPI0010ABCE32|nr:radical SAM protein [Desulfosediminicola ganghwensis]